MLKFSLFMFFIPFLCFIPPSYASNVNINWLKSFNDPLLMEYIECALNCNKDIKIAKQNILKYRQEKNLNISKLFPNINAGANYLLLKIPKTAIPMNDIQTNSFALPFNVIWEVDYLLKNYNNVQKGRLDVENAIYDLISSDLMVITDTASAYFNVSNLNKQIEEQTEILKLTGDIHQKRLKMYDLGVLNSIQINESEKILLNETDTLNTLKKERAVFLTNLACLIGKSPYNLDELEITPFDKINYTGVFPKSLKGSIILNRPDIQKLDNEIKKAKIDITIAKKDFLPKINIIGIMVFSTVVQNFGWDGVLAGLLAGASQNLFDGGKRIFNFKKSKIEYEKAVENYLKNDLMALKEVNDCLYTLKSDYETYKNSEKKLQLTEDNFIKVFRAYNTGAKSVIDYMDENSIFLKSKRDYYNLKNTNFNNLLSLFKAAGGGL